MGDASSVARGLGVAAAAVVSSVTLATGPAAPASVEAAAGAEASTCDFNGDGYGDVAVGVPGEDVGGVVNAGAVQVLYGSADGPSAAGNQWWDQGTPGVRGGRERADGLGAVLVCGDFDGDGFDDLAIGVPNEDIGSIGNAGAVQVLFGSEIGLTAEGNEWLDQGTVVEPEALEDGDRFGESLASGDFDGDGFDDLAIGIPAEDVGDPGPGPPGPGYLQSVGLVLVLYGSDSGLSDRGWDWWTQDTSGIIGGMEAGDEFGGSLASGDFDGDGFDDLAVGVPAEGIGAIENVGAVQVLFGSDAGLTSEGNQWWDQGTPGIIGSRELNDRFGGSLASGDFDGDGFDDLAVGVHWEDIGSVVAAGAVQVLFGSDAGLTSEGNQWWDQGTPGIIGGREFADEFGHSVASGDFDGDGFDDLAVGVPREDVGPVERAGVVQVLLGSGGGLTAEGNQWWDQGTPGIPGLPEPLDRFGHSVASGDFDADGFEDVVIGVVQESIGPVGATGSVQVLFGSDAGPHVEGNQWWDQGTPGILGGRENSDAFGHAVAG